MSGELLSVRLRKPWGEHKAGEAVLVDRLRAWKLEDLRIGSIEPPDNTEGVQYESRHFISEDKAPARPPRDKMVRASKKKGKGRGK